MDPKQLLLFSFYRYVYLGDIYDKFPKYNRLGFKVIEPHYDGSIWVSGQLQNGTFLVVDENKKSLFLKSHRKLLSIYTLMRLK